MEFQSLIFTSAVDIGILRANGELTWDQRISI